MEHKTHKLLFTFFGLASVVALGAVLGSRHTRPALRRLRQRASGHRPPDRDALEHLVEKFSHTMPEDEARVMRARNREQLRQW